MTKALYTDGDLLPFMADLTESGETARAAHDNGAASGLQSLNLAAGAEVAIAGGGRGLDHEVAEHGHGVQAVKVASQNRVSLRAKASGDAGGDGSVHRAGGLNIKTDVPSLRALDGGSGAKGAEAHDPGLGARGDAARTPGAAGGRPVTNAGGDQTVKGGEGLKAVDKPDMTGVHPDGVSGPTTIPVGTELELNQAIATVDGSASGSYVIEFTADITEGTEPTGPPSPMTATRSARPLISMRSMSRAASASRSMAATIRWTGPTPIGA